MHKSQKILFVSGFLPSRRVPSGGQKLVCRILEALSAIHEVTLLAFCNEKELPYLDYADFNKCTQVKIFKISHMTRAYSAVRYPLMPMISCARFGIAHDWLRRTVSRKSHDLAWFEFIQCASLMTLLPRDLPSRLVVHDLFFQAHERRAVRAVGPARIFWQWEARRTKRWESHMISSAKDVITLTEKDRQVAESITGRRDISIRYPEVDEVYHSVGRSRGPRIACGIILFWGQMSRRENEDAVIWFVQEILPLIHLQRPQAKLVIAGANPGPSILKLASGNVEVTGFVADPVLLFQSAEVAIAPLRLGAGIKIKVAEYLAAGIPTVVTTVGAEGIRPSSLLRVADAAADFSSACVSLMAAPSNE